MAPALPFPKDFDDCWETDGLHFSPQGSKTLGEALAVRLAPILRELRDRTDGAGIAPLRKAPRLSCPMPERIVPTSQIDAVKNKRRLLAFGDSLTAGYWGAGH